MDSNKEALQRRIEAKKQERAPAKMSKNKARRLAREEKKKLREKGGIANPKVHQDQPYEFKQFERKDTPSSWYDGNKDWYLVCARLGNVTEDYAAKMALWYRANMGAKYGIEPTEDDMEAAKGLSLLDLVPRVALLPIRIFRDSGEAESFMRVVYDYYEGTAYVQVMRIGEWNVTPPYTTMGKYDGDDEVTRFMSKYRSSEKMNYEALKKRIGELEDEAVESILKKGTVPDEELSQPLPPPENISGLKVTMRNVEDDSDEECDDTLQHDVDVSEKQRRAREEFVRKMDKPADYNPEIIESGETYEQRFQSLNESCKAAMAPGSESVMAGDFHEAMAEYNKRQREIAAQRELDEKCVDS